MTLQELKDQRALVYASYTEALKSQEYQIGQGGTGRRNRRVDFEPLRLELARLDSEISRLETAANLRVRRVRYLRPNC